MPSNALSRRREDQQEEGTLAPPGSQPAAAGLLRPQCGLITRYDSLRDQVNVTAAEKASGHGTITVRDRQYPEGIAIAASIGSVRVVS